MGKKLQNERKTEPLIHRYSYAGHSPVGVIYHSSTYIISYDSLDNKGSVPIYRINEIRFVLNLIAIIF